MTTAAPPKFLTTPDGFRIWPPNVRVLTWKVRPTVGAINPKRLTRADAREGMRIATGLWHPAQDRFAFQEVPDGTDAHILVGEANKPNDDAIARSNEPNELGFCNITINLRYKFAVDWRTWISRYDLATVLGHELGHAMGLHHIESTKRAIMFPRNGGERYRNVTKADKAYFKLAYSL